MTKRGLLTVVALLAGTSAAMAQTPDLILARQNAPAVPAVPASQAPPSAPAVPARATQGAGVGAAPRNIRFDIAITDSGATKPVTKSVTLNVSQGGTGSIRTSAAVPGAPVALPRTVPPRAADGKTESTTQTSTPTISLNVDVSNPVVYEDGAIRAMVVIEYQPYLAPSSATGAQPAVVRANSMSVFTSGQKMVLLQAADPLSDRRTVIEVTATIVK